jgi:hypothetical protein
MSQHLKSSSWRNYESICQYKVRKTLFDVLNVLCKKKNTHTQQLSIVLVQHPERYEMCNVAMLRVMEVNNTYDI